MTPKPETPLGASLPKIERDPNFDDVVDVDFDGIDDFADTPRSTLSNIPPITHAAPQVPDVNAAVGQAGSPGGYASAGQAPAAGTSPAQGVIAPPAPTVIPASAGDLSRTSEKYQSSSRKRGNRLRVIISVAVVLLLAYGVFQVVKGMFKEDINQRLAGTDEVAAGEAKEALTPMVATDPFYMMLIGSDVRESEEETVRSDTNIVARIDPQTGTVNLISIPRDTAINLEGYGTQKFNAAFAYYGVEGAIKAAEGLLGIQISHYAQVDFGGMVELVNAMGGVDVDVPMRIEDANAGNQIIEAGPQHLDGEQALIFARSRSYSNGDFQRTANQRILLQALLSKMMGMNRIQLAPVMDAAANYMTSDMTVDQMEDYALLMQNFEEIHMYSVMVPSTTATSEGVSYVVCDTELLRQVMELVSQGQDPAPIVNDQSVLSSAQAIEQGAESTPIYEPD